MKNDPIEKETRRIANAIVDLVERTDGFVTLAEVEREVAGFAEHGAPSWSCVNEHAGKETVFWNGMTEAGEKALKKVLRERRVTIQFVNLLPYILENCIIKDANWQPIVLLPARAANLDTPNWLLRLPQAIINMQTAEQKAGCRPLTPSYVRATADQFFGVNTDGQP